MLWMLMNVDYDEEPKPKIDLRKGQRRVQRTTMVRAGWRGKKGTN